MAISGSSPSPPAAHPVVLVHRGAFAHATCASCDWTGPGRRALSRAREDAEAHQLLGDPQPLREPAL